MEESELTRKAIEELMNEMNEYKEKESMPTERKKNPLGRPNKRFLGRTINSMMTHNKRQIDRNHQRCQRKLKELDAKQKKGEFLNFKKDYQRKSKSLHEVISSSSYDDVCEKKNRKKLKKKKRKYKKRTSMSSSSSCSSCETDSSSSHSTSNSTVHGNRKKKRHKKPKKENEDYDEDIYNDYEPHSLGYYVDPNMAYAAMAYNQINHLLNQQIVHQQLVSEELDQSIEIPSDLSTSCHSDSSLNISLNTSSAEEDENGILTFKLSSEDEEKFEIVENSKQKPLGENREKLYSDENDKDSIQSHISLDSEVSQQSSNKYENVNILSSSDSEELIMVETIKKNHDSINEISFEDQKRNNLSSNTNQQFTGLDKLSIKNTSSISKENAKVDKDNEKTENFEVNTKNFSVKETIINISMVDLTHDD